MADTKTITTDSDIIEMFGTKAEEIAKKIQEKDSKTAPAPEKELRYNQLVEMLRYI